MFAQVVFSFLAGVVTFISPCVLPLVPAYIFYITGIKADGSIDNKADYIFKILLFILGFTIVFTTMGVLAAFLSFGFKAIRFYINIFFGIVIIIFAFQFMGIINIFFLNMEKRFDFSQVSSSHIGAVLTGMAFSAGWTPCVGPVLSAILGMVASGTSVVRGAFLLFVFSLGLGVPLLLTALFFNYVQPLVNFLKKHSNIIKIISGIFLLIIGILILFGALNNINIYIMQFSYFIEDTMPISNYIFSIILFVFGVAVLIPAIINKKMYIASVVFFVLFVTLGILNITGLLPILSGIIDYLRFSGI